MRRGLSLAAKILLVRLLVVWLGLTITLLTVWSLVKWWRQPNG